jgi:hypothetical protein
MYSNPVIASVQVSGAFPHFSRNLQTGKSEITSSDTRMATFGFERRTASRIVRR